MQTTIPSLNPIRSAVLLPCRIASQFIRLDGRLGWLCLPQNPTQGGYELRTSFETRILPYYEGLFDTAEQTGSEDLESFYAQRNRITEDLTKWYAGNRYSGD